MKTIQNTLGVSLALLVLSLAGVLWTIDNHLHALDPIQPPPIPGATSAEQSGVVVMRGFALGRQYRSTLVVAHGDSWLEAARHFEDGQPWDDVRARWSNEDRAWRDDPFDRVIQPEIDKILGPGPLDRPAKRRAATLFIRSFAAGLKDRR